MRNTICRSHFSVFNRPKNTEAPHYVILVSPCQLFFRTLCPQAPSYVFVPWG